MDHKKFINLVLVVSTCLVTLGLAMVLQCLSMQINGEQLLSVKFSSPDFSKYNPFMWVIQIIYLLLAAALPILLMENE